MLYRVDWLRAAVLALAFVASATVTGQAAQEATIVMDMRDGSVIYAHHADRRQPPASLTKMMTLYLTFEAVRDGRLGLDQKIRVSRHAAREPASKLYLKPGQRVRVRDLIRAAAIKSANDAAMVLAEGVGGSQQAFAEMMTRKARALGMRNTTFKNPNGLPDRGHLSTVRDMAILARHLYFDFPQYYNIFGRTDDYAAGKHIWTTNRLLRSYEGADGIKTGYTRAAGYNLAASAQRGQKRILVVVFGQPSSARRNRRVAELLDMGFAKVPTRVAAVKPRGRRIVLASAPVPPEKPEAPETGLEVLASAFVPEAEAATPPPAAVPRAPKAAKWPTGVASELAPESATPPLPRGGARPAVRQQGGGRTAVVRAPVPQPRPGKVARAGDGRTAWAAEVGPYPSETAALAGLAELAERRVAGETAAAFRVRQSGGRAGKPIYSLHMAGLSEGGAARLCGALAAQRLACNVVQVVRR